MVRVIPNISMPPINYAMTQGGKMSFHVDPSALIYSNFEHVSGMAAPEGTQGASISKLNLLDMLISQLNRLTKSSPSPFQMSAPNEDANTQNIDSLIQQYTDAIKQAKSDNEVMPYTPTPSAQSGLIFSLLA